MEFAYNYLVNDLCISGNVVLACSGGPDSMALLSLLLDIRKVSDINIVVAHVNHNVRAESDDEEVFLRDFCNSNCVIFEYMKILEYSSSNFESEARYKRYQFFDEVVSKYNSSFLFTAHHGDDLIETILMRICRGSTLGGYSGFSLISKRNSYNIVRPLIHMSKNDILDYNNSKGISYVIDNTNFLDVHTRNKFRKYVLPVLRDINPSVIERFYKFSELISLSDDFIEKSVSYEYDRVVNDGLIDVSKFLLLDGVIGKRIIERYLFLVYSDLSNIGDKHVSMIYNLICSSRGNSNINLPDSFIGVKEYGKFRIIKYRVFDDYDYVLTDKVVLSDGKCIERVKSTSINSNYMIRLCSGDLCMPLHVRNRKSGDRIHIKGMDFDKKIKDVFIDCKVSIFDRDSYPIVVDSNGVVVWIPGLKKSIYDTNLEKCDIILEYH